MEEARENPQNLNFLTKVKIWLLKNLKSHAFFIVMFFASIPNPLFDLAGLICGQFLVPFWVFFGATLIGKAVIKVSLQCVFVIFSFSQHHIEHVLSMLEGLMPFLRGTLTQAIEK